VEVAIANSIWTSSEYKVKEKAQKALDTHFDMQSFPLKTPKAINDWVDANTKGKIHEVIDKISPDLRMGTSYKL
jgi:serine protease inhibitor